MLLESFERTIESARESLLKDKINVFDKHRVNSFIPRRTSEHRIWHKLQEPTYRKYEKVWKQLLCFLCRMIWQKQSPALHCCITTSQTAALDVVLQATFRLTEQQRSAGLVKIAPEQYYEIDRACLLLCIALLDRRLHGNIYDSVVVGFLAVLEANLQGSYHEATIFKKDYDIGKEMTWNDAQACHLADLARSIYTRGIEEAPGHVASARTEYRQISRALHSWLGFALYMGSCKGRTGSSHKRKASSELLGHEHDRIGRSLSIIPSIIRE